MVSNVAKQDNIETKLLTDHIAMFRQAINKLTSIPCKECSIIQIELLFFDILNIVRNYKGNAKANILLSQLQQIKKNKYQILQDKQVTKKNTLIAIRRFKNAFSQTLYKAIKDNQN